MTLKGFVLKLDLFDNKRSKKYLLKKRFNSGKISEEEYLRKVEELSKDIKASSADLRKTKQGIRNGTIK